MPSFRHGSYGGLASLQLICYDSQQRRAAMLTSVYRSGDLLRLQAIRSTHADQLHRLHRTRFQLRYFSYQKSFHYRYVYAARYSLCYGRACCTVYVSVASQRSRCYIETAQHRRLHVARQPSDSTPCPRKNVHLLFFEYLCQRLTDFNDFWQVKS